jgi:hypothetical protein
LEPVIRKLIGEWREINAPWVTEALRDDYNDTGSVGLLGKRWRRCGHRGEAAGARRKDYRPGAGAAWRLARDACRARDGTAASTAPTSRHG